MFHIELVEVTDRMTEQAIKRGYPCGSTAEDIIIAMVAKRPDWLPNGLSGPPSAIKRVYSGQPQSYHTILHMQKFDKFAPNSSRNRPRICEVCKHSHGHFEIVVHLYGNIQIYTQDGACLRPGSRSAPCGLIAASGGYRL